MIIRHIRYILVLIFVLSAGLAYTAEESNLQSGRNEETFAPGKFIMEHIGDSHEWHIATVGNTNISIPLPVILYSKVTGLHLFSSGNFNHGLQVYHHFEIIKEGKNQGKIMEHLADGSSDLPLDLSITKDVMAIFISLILLVWIFLSVAASYTRNKLVPPKGLQSLVEPVIIFVRDDIALPSIGKKRYMHYLPFLLSIFFFILLNNLMGLIPIFPGGANVTGNIAVTLVLAIITFLITTFSGNRSYWTHVVNAPGVPWWLKIPVPLMPVVEIIGLFTKPFVLMVRLFANISAGHIIALGFFSLIFIFAKMNIFAGYGISLLSVTFTVFMCFLELLVAFIQAYVFTLLSALYFGMATEEHH